MAQKKKHCSRRVQNQRRICLGRLWRYRGTSICAAERPTDSSWHCLCCMSRQSAVPQLYRCDDLKYCPILQLQSELHKLWTVYSPVKLQGSVVCG
jgi:hypothetical protein